MELSKRLLGFDLRRLAYRHRVTVDLSTVLRLGDLLSVSPQLGSPTAILRLPG